MSRSNPFVLFLLFFPCFHSIGQNDPDIKIGPTYEKVRVDDKVFEQVKDKLIAVKKEDDKSYHLQSFDPSSLSRKSYEEFEIESNWEIKEKIMEFNDQVYVLYSQWDRGNHLEQLFYREVDAKTGKFKGSKKIFDTDKKIDGNREKEGFLFFFPKYRTYDKFDFSTSFDDSHLLIQYRHVPEEKDDAVSKDQIGFIVLNRTMNIVWQKKVTMPYTEEEMNNLDYTVDSKGNVYLLAQVIDEEENGSSPYHLELLKLGKGDKAFQKSKVDVKDISFDYVFDLEELSAKRSLEIRETSNGLICLGYYTAEGTGSIMGSARVRKKESEGVFTFKFDENGKITDSHKKGFPVDLLKRNQREKRVKKIEERLENGQDVGMPNLKLQETVVLEDGSFIAIGEQFYKEEHSHNNFSNSQSGFGASNNTQSSTESFSYGHMVATKISPEGQVEWMRLLPKNQFGSETGNEPQQLSFAAIKGEKELYVVYVDNPKNLELKEDELPAFHMGRRGMMVTYQIGYTGGEVKKYKVLDLEGYKGKEFYDVEPRSFVETGAGTFVFEAAQKVDGSWGKDNVLIGVEF